MAKEYYTIRAIMEKFDLSYPTVLKMIQEGKIKAVKVKNKYLIPEKELKKIVK